MLTAEIIRRSLVLPLHLRQRFELGEEWVSSRSQWNSPRWELDTVSHGDRGYATVRWDIKLSNGRNLLHPDYEDLLDWLRRFIWSLYVSPGSKAGPLNTTSSPHVACGLSIFVPWLVEQDILWPHELTRRVVEAYLEDLPALIVAPRGMREFELQDIGVTTAYSAVSIVFRLWQQRHELEKAAIKPMPEHPSAELLSAAAIAKRIATQEIGWIQPLPDEVAIPVLNRAAWFLGTPADDILELRDRMEAAYAKAPNAKVAERWQRKPCYAWDFSTLDGEPVPWHPKLIDFKSRGPQRVLQLMKHLQAAALVSLQALTGVRVSELCGLPSGMNSSDGIPLCVERRPSASGLNEIFVLRTELSKTEEVPREVEWYLGIRPLGSNELPLPVRALVILERITEPYRQFTDSNRLLVSLRASRGLPKSRKGVAVMTRETVLHLYREFVADWVDLSHLPDESAHRTSENDLIEWRDSQGRIITTHQLRKTFALYVLSVEPRLMPAVRRQFQHTSLAMTEGSYWGRNPLQVEAVDSVSAQQTALLMYELATGRTKVAGKGGERLEAKIAEVRALVEGMNVQQGWRAAVKWTRNMGLESNIAHHGGCLPLASSEMECWKRADARPLGHTEPNYEVRNPGLCAGCQAFWMDARHMPHWEDRYVQNEVAARLGEKMGRPGSFRRIQQRAHQARNLLRHLDFDLSNADEAIEREVAKHVEEA